MKQKPEVFIVADNIVSPLGLTSADNIARLRQGLSGIRNHRSTISSEQSFYASLFDEAELSGAVEGEQSFSRFERLLSRSVSDALSRSTVRADDPGTVLIISTTKGNISLLENGPVNQALNERISLPHSAKLIAKYFNFVNTPVIVSNACISGLLALVTGLRLIRSGKYDHAVVTGADVISEFIASGFGSFQAISSEPCRPFDAGRNGLTLGEGAGTIILSKEKPAKGPSIRLAGGAVSNDANHISGPSRTGEELCHAIRNAVQDASLAVADIHFISAHGTATIYNDEMEARAITLAGMQAAPVNSLKGYYGHTLGAAGLIECIVSAYSLNEGYLFPTLGYQNSGVSMPLKVSEHSQEGEFRNCLKTASGFGGCNAAVVLSC